MLKLKDIFTLSHKFSAIERDMYYPDPLRKENDAEHAFQLALVAWYIIDLDRLPLNKERVFELCLAHDLVEVYAGDTPLWGTTGHDDKDIREKAALLKIKDVFPQTPSIAERIQEYKDTETEEARFVYALDKLLPFTNQIFTDGQVWKERNVLVDTVIERHEKQKKISIYLERYFEELIGIIRKEPTKYFN